MFNRRDKTMATNTKLQKTLSTHKTYMIIWYYSQHKPTDYIMGKPIQHLIDGKEKKIKKGKTPVPAGCNTRILKYPSFVF